MKALEAEALALQTCIQVLGELSDAGQRRVVAWLAAGVESPAPAPRPVARRARQKSLVERVGRPLSGASEKALELLAAGKLPSKVARELKMTRSAVAGVAYRAMRDGLLERVGRGVFRRKGES